MPSAMPRSRYSGSHPSTQMTTVGRRGFRYRRPFSSIVSDIARLTPSPSRCAGPSLSPQAGRGASSAYSLAPPAGGAVGGGGAGWAGVGVRGVPLTGTPSSMYHASDGAAYERFLGRWSRLLAAHFAEFARPPNHGRVLDVGGGTGSLALALAGA